MIAPGRYYGTVPFKATASDYFSTLVFAPGGPGLHVWFSFQKKFVGFDNMNRQHSLPMLALMHRKLQ
jgi:hypothetical protein